MPATTPAAARPLSLLPWTTSGVRADTRYVGRGPPHVDPRIGRLHGDFTALAKSRGSLPQDG
ncbi:hypothetical protein [Streptomyces sp. NPDC051014]|uniref:hypothetical protein n=1 Tax=Streptomyces sp. NPDC051014 TaxID=3155751 RepID=UPI0033D3555A